MDEERKVIGGLWDELFDSRGIPNEAAEIFCRKNGKQVKDLRRYVDEEGLEHVCLRWIEPVKPEDVPERPQKAPEKTPPVPGPSGPGKPTAPPGRPQIRILVLDAKLTDDKKKLEIMRQAPDLTGKEITELLKQVKK